MLDHFEHNIYHVYKAIGVDAKSEFAHEGQKLGQRSLSAKIRKYVLLESNFIFLYVKNISFRAKFCMPIVISLKIIEKIFFCN